jgi:hypothetical protein
MHLSPGDGGIPISAAHKAVKERDGTETGGDRRVGGGGLTAALTAKLLGGAIRAGNLGVDEDLELLHHVVVDA